MYPADFTINYRRNELHCENLRLFVFWPKVMTNFFFYLKSLFVTICPEIFSNRCVDSARGM